MKLFIVILLLISAQCYSQTNLHGTVIDSKTNKPLPFCNVSLRGSSQGCMTNEEGAYEISAETEKDTLIFSYIGYKSKIFPATSLLKSGNIALESKSIALKEVVVHMDNDYLYDVLEKSAKKLRENKQSTSKVYFQLETEIQDQPVEMLECYYNGYVKGSYVGKLLLKNGRIGIAESKDHGYFTNRNTSKAICDLNLTEQYDYLPSLVLQFNKSKQKKLFTLNSIEDDIDNYHIEFTPRKNINSFFRGSVWIDKKTFSILKIDLVCEDAAVHPFLPLFEGGSVKNVSMNISETYLLKGNKCLLNHVNFDLHLTYNNGQLSSRIYNGSNSDYEVHTNGVLYFYDYDQTFLLPYFYYDTDEPDYRKITSMPYNESFWKNNSGLLFTEKQKRSIDFFNSNGVLVNYSNTKSRLNGNYNVYEDNNIMWSDKNRIALKTNYLDSLLHNNTSSTKNSQYFLSNMYHLQAQIFLDLNKYEDSIQHFSATVFEVSESYYDLPDEPYTNCFLNIYFDLCEIERRNMEKILSSRSWEIQQIDSIYHEATMNMEKATTNYFKDVQTGRNLTELKKWNTQVKNNLNIDNFQLSGLKEK